MGTFDVSTVHTIYFAMMRKSVPVISLPTRHDLVGWHCESCTLRLHVLLVSNIQQADVANEAWQDHHLE